MKRLSIIVPVYNVEPYIERCLRSLEDQDIPKDDYEIICINDGSPDDSRGVVLHLQEEFKNIILIDQENQGVSHARNNGINNATGRYVLFIDSDDYIQTKSLSSVLKDVYAHDTQVSFLGYTILDENNIVQKVRKYDVDKDKEYQGIDAYFISRSGQTDPDSMVAVLFERNFLNINNLRYLPDVPFLEDGEFIARILCLAERCIFNSIPFYQRTTRPGSATNSKLFQSEKATNGFLLAAGNLKRFQEELKMNGKPKVFLNQPILKFVILSVDSSIESRSYKRFVDTVRTLKTLGLKRVILEGCNSEYRFLGKVFNVSPYLAALTLIIYPRINRWFPFNFDTKKIIGR